MGEKGRRFPSPFPLRLFLLNQLRINRSAAGGLQSRQDAKRFQGLEERPYRGKDRRSLPGLTPLRLEREEIEGQVLALKHHILSLKPVPLSVQLLLASRAYPGEGLAMPCQVWGNRYLPIPKG